MEDLFAQCGKELHKKGSVRKRPDESLMDEKGSVPRRGQSRNLEKGSVP